MYSFLTSAIKPKESYEWFVFHGRTPVELTFRNKPVFIKKGDRFGVRPSASKKQIRLILPEAPTKVITLTMDQAQRLAKGVKPGGL